MFRHTDKTSDVIGTRQAAVFQSFRALAGHEQSTVTSKNGGAPNPAAKTSKPKTKKANESIQAAVAAERAVSLSPSKKDMALTVRIEINLPTDASAETYDNIFKSIKVNLLNE